MAKDVKFGDSALQKLLWRERTRGCCESDPGTKRTQCRSRQSFGAPTVTKDGVSVAKEIELEDKFENMGAQMVKEVASQTSDAGDGTTATVLAQSIFNEGLKSVAAGMNPMDLKRGIDKAVAGMVEKSKSYPPPAKTLSQLLRLAPSLPIQTAKSGRLLRTPWTKSAKKE